MFQECLSVVEGQRSELVPPVLEAEGMMMSNPLLPQVSVHTVLESFAPSGHIHVYDLFVKTCVYLRYM